MTTINERISSLEESRAAMIEGINTLIKGQEEQTKLLGNISGSLNEHTGILNEHTGILNEHSKVLGDHTKLLNSIVTTLQNQSADLTLIKTYLG